LHGDLGVSTGRWSEQKRRKGGGQEPGKTQVYLLSRQLN
jgi:hypothetical protein